MDAGARRQRTEELLGPGDHVGVGLQRDGELLGIQRAHDQQPGIDARRAQRGASCAVARASHVAPPFSAARAAVVAPCP